MSETWGCVARGRHPPYPPGQEGLMDPNVKKTTLRMIPYGLYVLTAAHADGRVAAGTVNWVTQASFEPPLVAVRVQTPSPAPPPLHDPQALALQPPAHGPPPPPPPLLHPPPRPRGTGPPPPSPPRPPTP